jgi:HK97 family phage major capsid protein
MRETTDFGEVKKVIEDIGRTFEEYKSENDARLEALGAGDESKAAEINVKLTKMDGHFTKLLKLKSDIEISYKALQARVEDLESRRDQPGATTALDKTRGEYKGAFISYVRNASQGNVMRRHEAMAKMSELAKQAKQQAEIEGKAVNLGTGPEGGFAVPEEISREIERLELKFSPVRTLVKVRSVGTSDYKELVDEAGQEAAWAGEETARAETAASTLRQRTPTMGELYAYPKTTLFALEDMFFNVEQWLSEGAARAFARTESEAVIRGNGTNKPTGLLNTAPVTADDFASPLRDHAAFEFIQGTGSPPTIEADNLFDVVYQLNSAYRAFGTWVMNSLTTGVVRKLKDLNGQYHWQPGLSMGQPDRLLGYPTATWEQLDDVGAGNHPIAFGDWQRAYVLVDRVGLMLIRDEITQPGFVKFYIRRRVGGTVLNNDAAKWLKCP